MKKHILSLALAMIFVVSMAVPVFAAGTKDVKITAKYGKGSCGKSYGYIYTLPNVIKTETMPTADKADEDKWAAFTSSGEVNCAFAGDDVTVYTIKKGEKISLKGAYGYWCFRMEYKDGKLYGPDDSCFNYDEAFKFSLQDSSKMVNFGNEDWYMEGTDKSYFSISKTGYYAFMPYSFFSPYSDNGSAYTGLKEKEIDYDPKCGAVILHVVN